jgi:integrase
MAKTVQDAKLGTRAARARLKARHEPYWRAIDQGRHLGYRKGLRGGVWIARCYAEGKYRKRALGPADDISDATQKEHNAKGIGILSYRQALEKAREWFDEVEHRIAGLTPASGPYTVGDAMSSYLKWYDANNKPSGLRFTRTTIEAHIRPKLGHIKLSELTSAQISKWHRGLEAAPARLRSGKGKPIKRREAVNPEDAEGRRARKATANRILTVLKAGLNYAWREGDENGNPVIESDLAWRKIKPFKNVDAARTRYLSVDECLRLINACPSDFRKLVQGALLTGCRFSELTAMKCSDYNADSKTVTVTSTTSKSSKTRHVPLTQEGTHHFETLTAGRPGEAFIFLREDNEPWKRAQQGRRLREAAKVARVANVSFHILRHTYASHLALKGVPLQIIAEGLGHSDSRMAERFYAHLEPSVVAETIRANLPRLGIVEQSNVASLTRQKA